MGSVVIFMENYGNYLKEKLWEISSELSNNKDINEFKKYILGFIFYKYLSEKIDFTLSEELKIDNLTFEEAYNIPDYSDALKDEAFDSLGYFIEPEFLFKNLVEQAKVEDENFLSNVERALKKVTDSVIGRESAPDFENLFSDINLNAPILGNSVSSRSKSIGELFTELNSVDFKINEDVNYLADSFEFLITNFAIATGSQANKLYTPKTISNLISKLVTYGKDRILNVFDPACGSCSLLLNIKNEVSISNYFGQEIIQTTYNHARMNMILHDVHFEDFDIKQGDSIENPKFLDDKFEVVVSHPPFSENWSANNKFLEDERFSPAGRLPPKSREDYAFVEDMIYHLDENGIMAVVLPHGVLFRGHAEKAIRKHLINEKNYLDAIIGLPSGLFHGNAISAIIMIFKKDREEDDNILFIDASKEYEKIRTQNIIPYESIDKIVDTYVNRLETDKFSHCASLSEIGENDFNLNIPRYVDTFEEEDPIDLDEVCNELEKISNEIEDIDNEIKKYCDELGIRPPIF